jgi:hypothetical protein
MLVLRLRMVRVNWWHFLTLGFRSLKCPSAYLFHCILFVFLIYERATCDRYVADAFYSGAKGAQLINIDAFSGDVWVFDCTAEITATIKIAGQSYPIHPLDMSRQDVDNNGNPFCYGSVRVAYLRSNMLEADLRNSQSINQ